MDAPQNNGHCAAMRIKQYMETNYDADLSFSRMAKGCYFNEGYLRRIFRETTGRSISGFLNDVRIDSAKRLLGGTDRRILEISMQVGFHHVTYFNRVFKQKTGMTPLQYRKQAAGGGLQQGR